MALEYSAKKKKERERERAPGDGIQPNNDGLQPRSDGLQTADLDRDTCLLLQ